MQMKLGQKSRRYDERAPVTVEFGKALLTAVALAAIIGGIFLLEIWL